jgi:hypothetical protein
MLINRGAPHGRQAHELTFIDLFLKWLLDRALYTRKNLLGVGRWWHMSAINFCNEKTPLFADTYPNDLWLSPESTFVAMTDGVHGAGWPVPQAFGLNTNRVIFHVVLFMGGLIYGMSGGL